MRNDQNSQELTIQQAISRAKKASKQGKIADAVEIYSAILQQQPNHSIAKKALRKLQKGPPQNQSVETETSSPSQDQINSLVSLYQSGQMAEGEQACKELLNTYPQTLVAINVLGATLEGQGKLQEAVQAYNKAIQLNPDYAVVHYNLGNTLQELGRSKDAEASYRKAIALKSDFAEAHSNLGITLQELGRSKDAEASFRKAIALKSDYAEAHYNLGNTLKELGRLEEAEASYRQAIAITPDYAKAHNNLGVTLEGLGRLEEAEASYRQAITLKSDYAEAFWNLSSVEKTIQGAEHWIDKCLIADANHERAKLTKAALRFYQGDSNSFDNFMQSKFKQHAYMRSFSWVFSLPNLPELYFNRWYFLMPL